jgi:cobalamin biosynthetic protein CobC
MTGRNEKAVDHGGSLARARALFPQAPEPWLDLSTGISPHAYPFSPLPATAFSRLPEPGRALELATAAAAAYGAPSSACVACAPGTQILLPRVAALVPPGRGVVLGPTYAEHAVAARSAGHAAEEVTNLAALAGADLAIIVNPNNPDGRGIRRKDLLALRESLVAKSGLLVVDEAFMDVGPAGESVAGDIAGGGLVVLRSFGKFFGLAGLRLGFAIADPIIAAGLSAGLGPWAVSGPAIEIGLAALRDRSWQDTHRRRLERDAARLDRLLAAQGINVGGGTSLHRFVRMASAAELFRRLGEAGIIVRHFVERPHDLRFGLPGTEAEWQRLETALAGWRARAA